MNCVERAVNPNQPCPLLGLLHWNFTKMYGVTKLESLGFRIELFACYCIQTFWSNSDLWWTQTDGQHSKNNKTTYVSLDVVSWSDVDVDDFIQEKRHQILKSLIRAGGSVNAQSTKRRRRNGFVTNYVKTTFRSGNTLHWPLMYAIDTGYMSLVRILLLAGSTVPLEEVRQQQASSGQFFDNSEILQPVVEWIKEPPSLQNASRMAVRRAIAISRYHRERIRHFSFVEAVALLPVADRVKNYLNFADLDQVIIQRARVLHGADQGMIQMQDTAACGLTPSTFQRVGKGHWPYCSI